MKTDQKGVLELAGKALDEKTLVLPCWLNRVRLSTPLAEARLMWFPIFHLNYSGY